MVNPIRLLSLNVSIFDENNDRLGNLMKDQKPDIVALQEVTRKVDESASDPLISKTAIDRATPDLAHSFYAPNWALRSFRQRNFHGKEEFLHDFGGVIEFGNYTRSRFGITAGKSVFVQEDFSYMTDWDYMEKHPGHEPRMVQVTDIKIEEKTLRIINYHGIWSRDKKDTDRTLSAGEKLLALAREVDYPVIICGDFNLFPDAQSMRTLSDNFTSLVDVFHIQSTRPKTNELHAQGRNVVDYMFVSKGIEVRRFEVLESDASDHLPMVLDFVI